MLSRRVRSVSSLLLFFCGCLLLSGCSYLQARGRDLGDSVRGGVALSLGLYAEVEASSYLQPAVGIADVSARPRWGWVWEPRGQQRPGRTRTAAFPTLLFAWPYYGYSETEAGYGDSSPYWRGFGAPWILMGNHHVQGEGCSLFALHRWLPNPRWQPHPRDSEATRGYPEPWLGISATLLVVGVDAGFQPLEFVDFLTGCFGWDLLNDDELPRHLPQERVDRRKAPESKR